MDRSYRQKTNKDTVTLNDTINQIALIDIYRICYPKIAEYTFFSSVNKTFSKLEHMLGHKISLNKFKNIKIISSIFSDFNGMKVEINYN